MKKRVLILLCFLVLFFSKTQAQPPSFKFMPDAGIRIDCVAIAHATLINDTLFLFYNQQLFNGTQARRVGIATQSSDWLTFDTTYNYADYQDYFIRYQMPDSSYRKYVPVGRDITSESSATGHNYVPDAGIRYSLQPSDSVLGVRTYVSAPDGSVHMFYNTTGQMLIACRHAVAPSGDNGTNFTFAGGNVFGDSLATGGTAYVDPNALLNPDGSISVYLMNQHGGPFPPAGRAGHIHSFTSYDNGQTFSIDRNGADSTRFKFNDFDGISTFPELVYSLNDPKAVILPDGRYRVYVTAMLVDTNTGTNRYAIVSATSHLTNGIQAKDLEETKVAIWPNPSVGDVYFHLAGNEKTVIEIFDVTGKKIKELTYQSKQRFKVHFSSSGIFLIKIRSGKQIQTEKIIIAQ